MTPQQRKRKTERLLTKEEIPFNQWLPFIETEEDTKFRKNLEVGKRMICLYCVVGSAFHRSSPIYKNYLKEHRLWDDLTPDELKFLSRKRILKKHANPFSWRCEALTMLMWCTGLFDRLPLPRVESSTSEIVSRFPPVEKSPWPFIRKIRLRPKSEILDQSDLIYRLHWAARQAWIDGKPAPSGLNTSMIYEWHYAINWLTCYNDAEWDEVTTDT